MNRKIYFRASKELYEKLERSKKKHGFINDSDFMRWVIDNLDTNNSIITLNQRVKRIENKLDKLSTRGVQSLRIKQSKKSP